MDLRSNTGGAKHLPKSTSHRQSASRLFPTGGPGAGHAFGLEFAGELTVLECSPKIDGFVFFKFQSARQFAVFPFSVGDRAGAGVLRKNGAGQFRMVNVEFQRDIGRMPGYRKNAGPIAVDRIFCGGL